MKREPLSGELFGAHLSRREALQSAGAMFVGISCLAVPSQAAENAPSSLDPTRLRSWIEIHEDSTVVIRTGKPDFGQGTPFTAYRQIVAEELHTSFHAITTVFCGDTENTPDGSGAFDYLGRGMPNLRKAAAYAFQGLLELAARHLASDKAAVSCRDGVFFVSDGRSVNFGALVRGKSFDLLIPVSGEITNKVGLTIEGEPPLKPVADYSVIGQAFPNEAVASKVRCREQWLSSVRLPGMLHARVIHPKSLGSTLVDVGVLDKKRFPTATVFVQRNLLAVISPTEWECIQAARHVAATTRWTDWAGLPGSDRLFDHLRGCDWASTSTTLSARSSGDVESAASHSARRFSATYEVPYMKHASIGTTIAVADVRPNGMVYLYSQSQNPQALRGEIAFMLGCSPEKVVVRSFSGTGQYGRSNGGNAGGEDEAVILSRKLGRPVRVQWSRQDDFQWSTQSPAAFANIEITLDASGQMKSYSAAHHMPPLSDDRLVGAVLAGLPTMPAPEEKGVPPSFSSTRNVIHDVWAYENVSAVRETGHGTFQVGQKASPIAVGLRDKSMRTPGQFQQNFARELAISEAAALAGKDALQFRIDHARSPRIIGVLEEVRRAAGWVMRPSPSAMDQPSHPEMRRGRGVSFIFRANAYWACVCEIGVALETGKITVEKYTVAVDPGIVINPLQLKRQIEGGAVMGISQALLEEVKFDERCITSRDWRSYPIITMGEIPPITVALVQRPSADSYGGGSEAANALASASIAAALFDATGKVVRRLPLRQAVVKAALSAP